MHLPPLAQSSVPSSVPLHFAGRELGPVSLVTGIPFLSPSGRQWVQARTGQEVTFDKLSPTRPPWEKERAQRSNSVLMNLQSQGAFELPDRNVVERHFDLYQSSLMQRIFPVVDTVLFSETIKAAYQQPYASLAGQSDKRACVFAFLAFSSFIGHPCHHPELDPSKVNIPPIDGEVFVPKVQQFIPQLLQDPTTLDSLQAILMLVCIDCWYTPSDERITDPCPAVTIRAHQWQSAIVKLLRPHIHEYDLYSRSQYLFLPTQWGSHIVGRDQATCPRTPPQSLLALLHH